MAMLNDASGLIRYTLSAVTRISGPVLIPWIPFWNPGLACAHTSRFTFLRAENGPDQGSGLGKGRISAFVQKTGSKRLQHMH